MNAPVGPRDAALASTFSTFSALAHRLTSVAGGAMRGEARTS